MKLVIVESPAKAKTIGRFLGPEYRVEASYGHIRDLPRSADQTPPAIRDKPWGRLAVDTEGSFTPFYIVPPESRRHVRRLRKIVAEADEVLLATDEDREGESISWHLLKVLKPSVPVRRIAFHEITRSAIDAALANPGEVNGQLVQAQEARRVLDRLYGYTLSPVLWKKVRTKLSAGRVQSVALRLIVDREEERRRFSVSEYWRVNATLSGAGEAFSAILVTVGRKPVATSRSFDSTTGKLLPSTRALVLRGEEASSIATAALAATPWSVTGVQRKSSRQRPGPPFTTSTLQQAASSRLRMSPKRTMQVAQRLYEGIDLGGGNREGLITYMRTDSVTLSNEALGDVGRYVERAFGSDYYQGPRRYRTKAKAAQEAHEGIRPTKTAQSPDQVARFLRKDELALYRLIWNRAVASQMTDAKVDRTTIDLLVRIGDVDHTFRAKGSVLRFPGFLKVYGDKRKDQLLPHLEAGDRIYAAAEAAPKDAERESGAVPVVLHAVEPERRETKPPPRYSEASLVKRLEKEGIGRPSTYTPTISTIQERDYVRKRRGSLVPTYTGMAVNQLLSTHFEKYVDLRFTARMEDALDDIAVGEADKRGFLEAFYRGEGETPGLVGKVEKTLPAIEYPAVPIGVDPETGQTIRIKIGRHSAYAERGEGRNVQRATIPDDLLIDELTVERVVELLDAPVPAETPLGMDPTTGLPVYVKVGRYGPYAQLGDAREVKKPRRIRLPEGVNPADVALDYALRLLRLPRVLGKDPSSGQEIRASLGRYGPYVQRARDYRSLESLEQAFRITLDEALVLLNIEKPRRRRNRKVLMSLGTHPETGAPIELIDGRYGPYVTDDSVNASIPRSKDPLTMSLEEAVELLAEAAARRKTRRPRARRRTAARGR